MNFISRWILLTAAVLLLCLLSIFFVDIPLERVFEGMRRLYPSWLAVGAVPLVLGFAAVAAFHGWRAWQTGVWPPAAQATVLAAASALIALVMADLILKPLFGRLPVDHYIVQGWPSGFRLFHGDHRSTFPSGHVAVMAAVATILDRFFPRYRFLYIAVPLAISAILVTGYWHFVSDIIAGAFLGASIACGALALWPYGLWKLTKNGDRSGAPGFTDH